MVRDNLNSGHFGYTQSISYSIVAFLAAVAIWKKLEH